MECICERTELLSKVFYRVHNTISCADQQQHYKNATDRNLGESELLDGMVWTAYTPLRSTVHSDATFKRVGNRLPPSWEM